MNPRIKIIILIPDLLARAFGAGKTGFNLIIFYFNIYRKLSIIRCDINLNCYTLLFKLFSFVSGIISHTSHGIFPRPRDVFPCPPELFPRPRDVFLLSLPGSIFLFSRWFKHAYSNHALQ